MNGRRFFALTSHRRSEQFAQVKRSDLRLPAFVVAPAAPTGNADHLKADANARLVFDDACELPKVAAGGAQRLGSDRLFRTGSAQDCPSAQSRPMRERGFRTSRLWKS